MKKLLFFILFLGFSITNSFAQDARTWRASVGAGLAFKRNLRVGNTYENLDKKLIFKFIPMVTGNIGRFSLGPQGLAVRAWGNPGMSLSAFVKREGDRYHGASMDPRKDSVFVGLSAKFLNYGLNISKDINGRSHGYLTQLNYGTFYPVAENFVLRAGLSLDWMDDRYVEYYYSVRKAEATTDRQEYHLNNAFQPGVSVLPIYKLTENTSLMGALSAKFVPKTIRNSPTMNRKMIDLGGLIGLTYTL